ncbi:hypothetical protein AAFF_G00377070 [Aldrovandia affinis]|uniref:ZP domain-containing protein n=1 Tax=Aldrovandia affinis TaxID=143900 RepID=A0AAD7SHV0_9TELE|nr:hypothetical protein AAFF_G00377070 [Aldrovandia affinis]
MTYEDLTLRGLVVSVHVNLVDKEKGKVENALIQRCTFPIRELLVCLPERRMVLVADTSHISPPIEPRRVTLLDPSCGPIDTDRTRALFSLSLDSCGTIRTLEDNHLVYVNEVRYSPSQYPPPDPLTPPQSQYRLPIGCRYPVKDNGSLPIYHPHPGASLTFPTRRRTVRSHRGGSQQIPVVRVGGGKPGKVYRKAKSATVKIPSPHR